MVHVVVFAALFLLQPLIQPDAGMYVCMYVCMYFCDIIRYGPVGWGGPGVLDTLRLHAVASATLNLSVVIAMEKHAPSNPMYQFMASPLHLWAWRGEELVVAFILDHGQKPFINKTDAGFFGTPGTPLDFAIAHEKKLRLCLKEYDEVIGQF